MPPATRVTTAASGGSAGIPLLVTPTPAGGHGASATANPPASDGSGSTQSVVNLLNVDPSTGRGSAAGATSSRATAPSTSGPSTAQPATASASPVAASKAATPPSGSAAVAAPVVAAPVPIAPADGAPVTDPFTVSWSTVTGDPSGIVGYNWQISDTPTFTHIVLQHSVNSPATQDLVSGLPNGTYYWRVQAADGAFNQGAWSATRSVTVIGVTAAVPGTPVLAPPQAYTTFHPLETGTTSWTPAAGAATYVFETSVNDPTFSWSNIFKDDNLDKTTFTFDLGFEATLYSRVYAVGANGIRGLPSNVISYTYSFNNPIGPAPTLTSPIGGQTVTLPVTLTW